MSALSALRAAGQMRRPKLNPHQWTIIGFAILIWIGGLLLALPASSASGRSIGLLDALFTAASAVCVTGLVVVDTGSDFTLLGQLILLLLIQIGGLGFMTYGVVIAVMLGKRIGLSQRILIRESVKSESIQGLIRLVISICLISFGVELAGAFLLWLRLLPDMDALSAAYYAVFHAVSAFNNAGFALWPDSLTGFAGDPAFNLIISLLFITGGIGFVVLIDIYKKRKWRSFALHTKIVLIISGVLALGGFLAIFTLELLHPGAAAGHSLGERLWTSYFQSVTARTAGFNSVDLTAYLPATQFFIVFLMFIGASSGSTGGGIKTNTLMILLVAMYSAIRGREQVTVFKRRIGYDIVLRALAVILLSLGLVLPVAFMLTLTEPGQPFMSLLFEATSAFGTVGLSLNVTPELSEPGKLIVIFTMFAGRLGPLTLAYALAQNKRVSKLGYPEEKVLVG